MKFVNKEGVRLTTQEWVELFENDEYRQIAADRIHTDSGAWLVSTIWEGICPTAESGPFETAIIDHTGDCVESIRTFTERAARDMHLVQVTKLKVGR